jgi:hypothetical protein
MIDMATSKTVQIHCTVFLLRHFSLLIITQFKNRNLKKVGCFPGKNSGIRYFFPDVTVLNSTLPLCTIRAVIPQRANLKV